MEGRSLTFSSAGASASARRPLTLATLLLLARTAAAQQGEQPGNPTSLSGFHLTPTIEIAIGAGGGGLLLLIILLVTCCCVRRRRKKRLPQAQTPATATFGNMEGIPPAPPGAVGPMQSTATFETASSHYRQPSDRLPLHPTPFDNGPAAHHRTPSPPAPAYGGYGVPPPATYGYGDEPAFRMYEPDPSVGRNSMAMRRGVSPPPKLRIGGTPHPPSGAGLAAWGGAPAAAGRAGGWAAVGQTQAWGMHGRHIDQQGTYYGSVAQQGGQPPRGVTPVIVAPAPRAALAPGALEPAAVYGDDDMYAERARAAAATTSPPAQPPALQTYRSRPLPERPPTAMSTASSAAPAYVNNNPYRQPPAAAQPPSRMGTPANYTAYAPLSRGTTPAPAPAPAAPYNRYAPPASGAPAQSLYAESAHGDYGAGRYGHSRDPSAISDMSYQNYGNQRPAAPNGWL